MSAAHHIGEDDTVMYVGTPPHGNIITTPHQPTIALVHTSSTLQPSLFLSHGESIDGCGSALESRGAGNMGAVGGRSSLLISRYRLNLLSSASTSTPAVNPRMA
jgi:hypothetical protein